MNDNINPLSANLTKWSNITATADELFTCVLTILWSSRLNIPIPVPDKEKKLSEIFTFTLLCGASKEFMKALKTFIKPFETPQRPVKRKI